MHVKGVGENYRVLLLLRHAKSSWKNKELDDHDRPLNKRGKRDAIKMGKYLKKINMIPNAIVTSSALRTVETTSLVCRHCDYDGPVEVNFTFHKSGVYSYIRAISQTPVDRTRLLLIGHNPELEELVEMLTHSSLKMSTCTLVQINMYIPNWSNIISQNDFRSEIMNIWKP